MSGDGYNLDLYAQTFRYGKITLVNSLVYYVGLLLVGVDFVFPATPGIRLTAEDGEGLTGEGEVVGYYRLGGSQLALVGGILALAPCLAAGDKRS